MLVSTLNLLGFQIRERKKKPVCMLYLSRRLTGHNGSKIRRSEVRLRIRMDQGVCTLQESVLFRNRHIQESGTSQSSARFNFLFQLLSAPLPKFGVTSTLRILHRFLPNVPTSLRYGREVSSKLRFCWMLARLLGNDTPLGLRTCQSLLGSSSHSCEAYLRLVRQPSAILWQTPSALMNTFRRNST